MQTLATAPADLIDLADSADQAAASPGMPQECSRPHARLHALAEDAVAILTTLRASALPAGATAAGGAAGSSVHPTVPLVLLHFLEAVLSACETPAAGRAPDPLPMSVEEPKPAGEGAGAGQAGAQAGAQADVQMGECSGGGEAADKAAGGAAGTASRAEAEREEEEEERRLACRVCTFATTGSNFTEQHWYYCYTCGLTQSEGCCSVCVKVCHKGHAVSYSRRSRFFCDCGAGAAAARGIHCTALAPRRAKPAARVSLKKRPPRDASAPTGAAPRPPFADASSSEDEEEEEEEAGGATVPAASRLLPPPCLVFSEAERAELIAALASRNVVEALYHSYEWLLGGLARCLPQQAEEGEADLFATSKPSTLASDLLTCRHSVRGGAFDPKPKSDASHARELRTLLSSGGLVRSLLSLTTTGVLALAEGEKLHVLDTQPAMMAEGKGGASGAAASSAAAAALSAHAAAAAAVAAASSSGGGAASAASSSEKGGLRSLSRTNLGFEVVSVVFNPANEGLLLVAGLKEAACLTLGPRGEIASRLGIELMLDGMQTDGRAAHVVKAMWLPNSASKVAILTNLSVRVYDLTKDVIAPLHHYQTLDDSIRDIAFVPTPRPPPAADGAPSPSSSSSSSSSSQPLMLLAIASSGMIFWQPLAASDESAGSLILTETLHFPSDLRGRAGASLHYSEPTQLLLTSYADGRCFVLRLTPEASGVVGGFAMQTVRNDTASGGTASLGSSKAIISPLQHWQDVPGHRGLLIATCRKTLIPVALKASRHHSTPDPDPKPSPSLSPSPEPQTLTLLLVSLQVTRGAVEMQLLKPASKAEGLAVASASPPSGTSRGGGGGGATIWSMHEDGALSCSGVGKVTSDGGDTAFTAVLSRAITKRPALAGPPPKFGVDFFERTICVTTSSDISFTGDCSSGSSSSSAKSRLSANSEEFVVSPHKSSLTIHVHNASASNVPVGVRMLLGAAQPQHVPASLTILGRSIQTSPAERRWYAGKVQSSFGGSPIVTVAGTLVHRYDVPLTKAESVASAQKLTLSFSATHTGSGAPVLDALEVYVQTKPDFGWDAATASLAATYKVERPKLAAQAAASVGREQGGGGAAAGSQEEPAAPMLRALESALRQLTSFHTTASDGRGIGASAPYRSELLASLPHLLASPPACASLHRPARLLLRRLLPDRAAFELMRDTALLDRVKESLAAAPQPAAADTASAAGAPLVGSAAGGAALLLAPRASAAPTARSLAAHIGTLRRVAYRRPHSLVSYVATHPTLLPALVLAFLALPSVPGVASPATVVVPPAARGSAAASASASKPGHASSSSSSSRARPSSSQKAAAQSGSSSKQPPLVRRRSLHSHSAKCSSGRRALSQ